MVMATLHMPLVFTTPKPTAFTPTQILRKIHPLSTKSSRIQCSRFESFLDLKPELISESLDVDLRWHDTLGDRSEYDLMVIGGGPAGLRLAHRISSYGVQVCCIDPSQLWMWPNNYCVWVDELENLGLSDCLDKTWPIAAVYFDDKKHKFLDRPYGRVDRKILKTRLIERCLAHGVRFHNAKAWKVNRQEFKSMVLCGDGCELKGSLIVDVSSSFVDHVKPRNHGYQIAHGILAEVEGHPFDLDKMLLMDWRTLSHGK